MKYNVYLLSYNNYKNRQVKKLESINEYNNGGYILSSIPNVNFEMNDGISSKMIINSSFASVQPDYILVEDIASRVIDLEGNLVSSDFTRWFVIDTNLVRGNQYEFTLRRDVWVDHYDVAMNSTYFIERGYVYDSNDLIFNDEEQKFSQIKKSQTPLFDETNCPWIIGYIPRKTGKDSDFTITTNVYTGDANIIVDNLSNWSYYSYISDWTYADNQTEMPYQVTYRFPVQNNINGNTLKYERVGISLNFTKHTLTDSFYLEAGATQYDTGVFGIEKILSQFNTLKSQTHYWYEAVPRTSSAIALLDKGIAQSVVSNSYNHYNRTLGYFRGLGSSWYHLNNNLYSQLQSLNGQTIKDTTANKVYRISIITEGGGGNYQYTSGDTNMENLINDLIDYLPGSISTTYGSTTAYGYAPRVYTDDFIQITLDVMKCKISLSEVANVQTILPKDDQSNTIYRTHLVDAPYDMFAMPYGTLRIKNGANYVDCNKDVALAMATAFVTELGAENVYDLQLLPYCPVRQYIQNDGTFDITAATSTQVRDITLGGSPVNYVFYCSKSQFEITDLKDKNLNSYHIDVTNVKKQYNTEMYRLCSPNFASTFEFNAAQNGGVDFFQVTATYKPYTPYVRIHPKWGRMYGDSQFYDGRGLILQGDFSLPKITNAWTEYELQNKNYLNIFNREIQSLELQNKISGTQDWFKAISGVITGTVGGSVAGGYMGGNIGGIAGAGVGSIMSATGGALDITNNQKLRNDAIDKAQSNFSWNMQNIQALPYSLANVSSLTYDNALVPVLEFYQASDVEIDAFEKKMQFYGMSVMKVGQLTDYLNPLGETFIKGQLLRLLSDDDNLEADNHLATELSAEISKGLYIGEYIPQGS